MSGSGRKRVSKWDSKQEDTHNGDDYVQKSGSYYQDKDPEQAGFYPEGNNGRNRSRRSVPDDDDDGEHLKSRQHSGEAWPSRSRVSHEEGDASMMSYYDTKKSSEQDESRQPYWDRPRTRRSGSRSNSRSISRSRSRSPLQRARRDARGSYDRHKARDIDGRYNSRAGDYDWEAKNRDTKYYTEDSREEYPLRRSDYPEDHHSNSRRETSDPNLRSHRDRRDVPEREYSKVSNVPCRYFAFGNCRNGTSCRFSHNGPERKPQEQMFSRHDSNNNHSGATERVRNSHRWNERSDTGKSSEGTKGHNNNNGSWIDDMEMSPDWNYGVKTLKKPLNEERSVLKDTSAPAYEHGFSNNLTNTAPQVQAFNQNIENHSAVPYQSTPLAVGGSQVLLPPPPPPAAATHLPVGLNSSNPNTVSREELNHISNISASLAQFFGNGQPIPQLLPTLNPKPAMQGPEEYGKEEQSTHTQSDLQINNSIQTGVLPLQINNSDTLVSLAGNPKASSEENRDRKFDEEGSKEPDVRKTEQEEKEKETGEDADNVVVEEEEEEDDGNIKKEKDPKGMKAFKFALVEIVKELLKPAWKEGGMNKDAYKNIVKKAVDKVTGAIQTGNIPQTQEKIDHYLSASKPKLTKLVQAYISKVKKS